MKNINLGSVKMIESGNDFYLINLTFVHDLDDLVRNH